VVKTVAEQVPTTVEELAALDILGESKLNEYGDRLVRQIQSFVDEKGLQEYINQRPLKRPKRLESESPPTVLAGSEGKNKNSTHVSGVQGAGRAAAARSNEAKKSPYF
jgi:hypothetical protein